MYAVLETLRDQLCLIDGIASCKIGVEDGISPADYPLLRIVPERITFGPAFNHRTAQCIIYFAVDTTESEGLELVYENLLDLEDQVIMTIKANDACVYRETITDSDTLETYKLMLIRFDIESIRPDAS